MSMRSRLISATTKMTGETLVSLLQNHNNVVIIDCRTQYEMQGGHIKGSIPLPSLQELYNLFFRNVLSETFIVFHCEFSTVRAVKALEEFNNLDAFFMKRNGQFPHAAYPNTFLLVGGYHMFYKRHSEYCQGGYVDTYSCSSDEKLKCLKQIRKRSCVFTHMNNAEQMELIKPDEKLVVESSLIQSD
ncbi:M-phase inducer phosphatase, putative [Entamoeba invadens IP1]|uniref:protein-tyrosine-phosphatase n=1 Tax=Entamoeba invadens IP1 TaxID=370355 RepID=A0A0A1U462_ENTIV|nr:M-phase inducer phosphatase, putative [Entamoeba invadens IP1]ELP88960.1 M-phase inducer phosphatase, putative [Entamoeba invadens IP1]|eukprot:XP_004255731.1 M-phase inducer phosphatase, putative [Entamoeba invadens IP1]